MSKGAAATEMEDVITKQNIEPYDCAADSSVATERFNETQQSSSVNKLLGHQNEPVWLEAPVFLDPSNAFGYSQLTGPQ